MAVGGKETFGDIDELLLTNRFGDTAVTVTVDLSHS
jgi:hypothetical protein